jgi:hypothetical protein
MSDGSSEVTGGQIIMVLNTNFKSATSMTLATLCQLISPQGLALALWLAS